MKGSNSVHIIVETLSGTFEGDFAPEQKFQDVIDKTFLTLDIKPAGGEVWELRYENEVIDPQTTIDQKKIPSGSTLTLAPKEGGGGH